MQQSILSTAEAVHSLPRLLTGLAKKDGAFYITDGSGRARAVLLDIDKYNAMMDALEDKEIISDAKLASAMVKAIISSSERSEA